MAAVNVDGLVGLLSANSGITASYATGNVDDGGGLNVGGHGRRQITSVITASYATGAVSEGW